MFRNRTEIVQTMDDEPNNPGHVRLNGDISALLDSSRPRIAIVGTRDMDLNAKDYVRRIVNNLSSRKDHPIIVSGLALGVDMEAHMAALNAGLPTIAVVATGLDTVYPNKALLLSERIIKHKGSGIVTSFPDNTAPMAYNFLYRNRTIVLMSDMVIVVASKSKGGAIVTANLAYDWNIPVYAVPGRPDDVRNRGCNELIAGGIATPLFDFEQLQDLVL